MHLFFVELVKLLDKKRASWRNDTIILLDNAPYHTCEATMKLLEQLRIPVMFLGPHSYNLAPAELFFAHFKQDDINPRKLKMSKG
jgi:transposase